MCGIVGYVGEKECTSILIEGLRKLEYRGYDSAGIAVLDPVKEGLTISRVVRCRGKLSNLENLLRAHQSDRTDDESFSLFVDRHTDDELGAFLGLDLLAEPDPTWVPPPPRHAAHDGDHQDDDQVGDH